MLLPWAWHMVSCWLNLKFWVDLLNCRLFQWVQSEWIPSTQLRGTDPRPIEVYQWLRALRSSELAPELLLRAVRHVSGGAVRSPAGAGGGFRWFAGENQRTCIYIYIYQYNIICIIYIYICYRKLIRIDGWYMRMYEDTWGLIWWLP